MTLGTKNEGTRCPINSVVVLRGVECQCHYLMTMWRKIRYSDDVWRMWRCLVCDVCRCLHYKCIGVDAACPKGVKARPLHNDVAQACNGVRDEL